MFLTDFSLIFFLLMNGEFSSCGYSCIFVIPFISFYFIFLQETNLLGWDACMTCKWTGKEALYTFYFMYNL